MTLDTFCVCMSIGLLALNHVVYMYVWISGCLHHILLYMYVVDSKSGCIYLYKIVVTKSCYNIPGIYQYNADTKSFFINVLFHKYPVEHV